jgi:hypothetical protein
VPVRPAVALTLTLLLEAPILPVQAQQDSAKSDKEILHLLGQVKTFREEWCILRDDPIHPGEFIEGEHTFIYTLTFDRTGGKIKQDPPPYVCGTSLKIEARQKRERRMDENGRVVEETESDLGGQLLFRYTYAYDPEGRLTELTNYLANGTIQYKWVTNTIRAEGR